MGSLKFELSLFDGTSDFSSWRKKMRALLVQDRLQMALQDPNTLGSSVTNMQKKEIQENAYSIIVLYLANNVLKQIDGENTTFGALNKLKDLFMAKSLTNRILLKKKVLWVSYGSR